MKFARHLILALALGASAPLAAAELAEGEVTLHINAQGLAPADSAVMTIDLMADGADQAKAEAALRKREKEVTEALGKLGIGKAKISFSEPDFHESYNSEWDDYTTLSADGTVDGVAAATSAEAAAVAAETAVQATSALTVQVDDVNKIGAASEAMLDTYAYTTPRIEYAYRDEALSQRAAVTAAIVRARADADVYADALGLKVARITSVSNSAPTQGFADFFMQIASIDRFGDNNPLLSNKIATVTVDFVLAPK